MDLGLRGRIALITGGSRGIGAATARTMAAEGANLILVARDAKLLAQVRDEIRSTASVNVEITTCDLTRPGHIVDLARQHAQIDILINNAGAVPMGNLFDIPEADWRAGFDSKQFAYVHMCRAYYPLLKARGGGVIINVLGVASRLKSAASVWSGMGNTALEFLTEAMGATSHRDNIRVVGVSPGAVNTKRFRELLPNGNPSDDVRPLPIDAGALPFNRMATTEELAATIAFMASDRSSYTSGAIVVVDGGLSSSKAIAR